MADDPDLGIFHGANQSGGILLPGAGLEIIGLAGGGVDVVEEFLAAAVLPPQLEVHQLDWDSLVPAVQSGQVDCVIAGQSMTAERAEQVDFAGPYLYASIVCLTKADSDYANATGKADLAGGTCTSQQGTIWYDLLDQIEGAAKQEAAESAPAAR